MGKLNINIEFQPWEWAFLKSAAANPALIAGWGTGKSMAAICKALELSKKHPGNLGAIFRKERTNLEKSTIPDFKRYTNDFQNMEWREQKKELYIPRWKSTIMFLHADTVGVINNINLGWAWIEQADEIEDDGSIFDKIGGRCRRDKSSRQCFITSNAVDETHWVYRYWKTPSKPDDFPHWEASTFDNADFLPGDYLQRCRDLEGRNLAVYQRYCLNMFGISNDRFVLIPAALIHALQVTPFYNPAPKRVISVDPATGGDECVVYVLEDGKIKDTKILHDRDTMKIAAEVMIASNQHQIDDIAIDSIGLGKGIADRLCELGKNVQQINSAERSTSPECFNRRTEMWWYVADQIRNKTLPLPSDDELKRQLSSVRYKVLDSSGLIRLEPKEETKKRLGCSPDRADAFVYGVWGMRNVVGSAIPVGGYVSAERPAHWDRDSQQIGRGYGEVI